ncbi:cell division protein PerM [Gryllotalpicola ginsengisoli]|uniref:cell division protein PerM n=1 Tax=Gryllotalpicola ginsengisoli TaxID=444608 RepID=UPI0003B6A156|nr:DUF6350 family protein [Gryllotalpicola ginsengisoli]
MTRATVAVLAAFEALITAAIGIGVALAPLTIVWAVQNKMTSNWFLFWKAAVDSWLLGLGVDADVHLDRVTATGLGLPGAVAPFTVTIAALGVAFFTFCMGARVGRRAAETRFVLTGALGGTLAFGIAAWVVALTARSGVFAPHAGQAFFVGALTFGLGAALGVGLDRARSRDDVPEWFARFTTPDVRAVAGAALRAATGAVALVLAASAVFVALALFVHFGKIVALYEGLQAGYLGGATLTLAQLAFLPNAVIWAASWIIGPGFALGSGTIAPGSGGPGQLPGVPLIGIVPAHSPAGALAVVAIPVIAAVVIGWLTHRIFTAHAPLHDDPLLLAAVAASTGVLGGALLALLAAWSGGSLAPGSFAHLGPSPWLVGAIGAAELAGGAAIGLFARHFREQAMDWTPLAFASHREPDPEPERAREPEPEPDRV